MKNNDDLIDNRINSYLDQKKFNEDKLIKNLEIELSLRE